jgi:hypothetical protein
MKSFVAVPLLALFSFASIAACSSSSSVDGSAGSCTGTEGGNVVICFTWADLTAEESSALCQSGTTVASCPTATAIGTCAYSYASGGATYAYSETYYSTGGSTCAALKAGCVSSGSTTATFSGIGC